MIQPQAISNIIRILLITFCINNSLIAQNNSKSVLITYDGYHYAAGNDFKTIDTRTTLIITGSQSISYDSSLAVIRPLEDSLIKYPSLKKSRIVYKDRSKNALTFEGRNFLLEQKNMPISDDLFNFQWVFSTQSKQVGDYFCRKANCIWRGRVFAAWFTEEIPIPEGPWKFGGLPGLIVELYDDEKMFYWKLSSLKEVPSLSIKMPEAKATYAVVVAAFKKEAKRRIAAAHAQLQQINPDCIECNKTAELRFPTLENWAD